MNHDCFFYNKNLGRAKPENRLQLEHQDHRMDHQKIPGRHRTNSKNQDLSANQR